MSCPSSRAVRIDVGENHPMAPLNLASLPTSGSLNGVPVMHQGEVGNCVPHSVALLYKSISPSTPMISPRNLSTCETNTSLKRFIGGSVREYLTCANGKRFCPHEVLDTTNTGDVERYNQENEQILMIDRLRAISIGLNPAQQSELQKTLGLVRADLAALGGRDVFDNCKGEPPVISHGDNCEEITEKIGYNLMKLDPIFNTIRENNFELTEQQIEEINKVNTDFNSQLQILPSTCRPPGLNKYVTLFNSLNNLLPQHGTQESEFRRIVTQMIPQTNQIVDRFNGIGLYSYNIKEWAKSIVSETTSWDEIFREDGHGYAQDLIDSGLPPQKIKGDLASYHRYLNFNCEEFTLENLGRVFRSISACGGNVSSVVGSKVTEYLKGILEASNRRSASDLYQRIPEVNFSESKADAFQRFTNCAEGEKQTVLIPGFPQKISSNTISIELFDDPKFKSNFFLDAFTDMFRSTNDTERSNFIDIFLGFFRERNIPEADIQNAGAIFQNNQPQSLKRCFNGRKSPKASKRCARLFKNYVYQQLDNNSKVIKAFGIYTMGKKPASYIKSLNKQRKLVLRSTKSKLRRHLNSISNNRAVSLSICSEKIKNPRVRKRKILLSTGNLEFNEKNCGQHQVTAIGHKCVRGKLKVLIQNSWGRSCSPYRGVLPKRDCESSGKFWIDEDKLAESLYGITSVTPIDISL